MADVLAQTTPSASPSGLWRIAISGPESIVDPASALLERKALAVATVKQGDGSWMLEATWPEEPDAGILGMELSVLASALSLPQTPSLVVEPLPALDWRDFSYRGFPALKAGRFHIRGEHDKAAPPANLWPLIVSAATAFGSGEHATTRGCLLMLDHLARRKPGRERWRLADIGCGSGILALGWARATKAKALASDLDPEAVRVTRGNARLNGLAGYVGVAGGPGYAGRVVRQTRPYKLVVSNILARPLCKLAKPLRHNLAKGGKVVLSGLLDTQEQMVLWAHRSQRLYLEKRWRGEGWSVLLLSKRAK